MFRQASVNQCPFGNPKSFSIQDMKGPRYTLFETVLECGLRNEPDQK